MTLRIMGQALAAAGALTPLPTRVRGAVVLTYHDVTEDPSYAHQQVSPGDLRAQLRAALALGMEFVDLSDLTERAVAGKNVDGLAALSFDDAFVGIVRHALPVLADLGIPATVFAPSARLGTVDPDWYDVADRTMKPDELYEVAAAGMRVESHTRTHANLPSLDDVSLDRELRGARAELEDLIGQPVTLLAYPFGYFDGRVRDAAEAAGYRAAFTFLAGRIVPGPGLDPFRLPRLPMPVRASDRGISFRLRRPEWSFREHRADAVVGADLSTP